MSGVDEHWSRSPALNHFAAWAIFWLVAFGAFFNLVFGRWFRGVLYGVLAVALWRWLTSPAYLARRPPERSSDSPPERR